MTEKIEDEVNEDKEKLRKKDLKLYPTDEDGAQERGVDQTILPNPSSGISKESEDVGEKVKVHERKD